MPDRRRVFGDEAEALAARHLTLAGMRIVAHQYRTRYGEIDLIADDGGEIVFVEVKARKTSAFGRPEEAVTRAKLQKIARVAIVYLRSIRREDAPHRIDVVAIEYDRNPPFVTHLRGVGG